MFKLGSAASPDRVAAGLSQAASADEGAAVSAEQLRMVLLHTRVGTLAATAFGLFGAAQLQGTLPAAGLWGWVAAKLAVAAARIVLAGCYARRGRPAGPFWPRLTYAFLALDGAVWGAAGALLMTESEPLAALAGAVLACISCVATFGLQVRSAATAAYVVPILLPTALALAWRGDRFGLVGGIGLLVLLVLQVTTARAAQQRLADGMLLRLRAQALAEQKEAALQFAQRESAVKSEFIARLSHELRTPLHGILGLARLVHDGQSDPALARRVELIEAAGTHLLALINDLLDVSRIETGHFTTRSDRFELVELCEQVAGLFAPRAAEKGLRFEHDLALPRPCWVVGDAARVRQVLHNLVGNAIKFTERGEVRLAVARTDAPDQIRFAVTDTGVGIAQDDLEHIFRAFHQAERTPGHPREGAGLGLTISREIAQSLGGDISVESRLGAGSCFVFMAQLAAAERAEPVAPPPAEPTWPGRRVLVAEDDDVNALIVGAFLDRLGLTHERVADGRQAVERAVGAGPRPDLVLMDLRMPELDGLAATREIRAREHAAQLPAVPVIALTATTSDEDQRHCAEAGMQEMLAKPFTLEQLQALLQRHVGPPGG